MTTPSGQISASNINTELGRPAGQQISLSDGSVRNLAGVGSGQISYSQLRNRSSADYTPDYADYNNENHNTVTGINQTITLSFNTVFANDPSNNYGQYESYFINAVLNGNVTRIYTNNQNTGATINVNNGDNLYFAAALRAGRNYESSVHTTTTITVNQTGQAYSTFDTYLYDDRRPSTEY